MILTIEKNSNENNQINVVNFNLEDAFKSIEIQKLNSNEYSISSETKDPVKKIK